MATTTLTEQKARQLKDNLNSPEAQQALPEAHRLLPDDGSQD